MGKQPCLRPKAKCVVLCFIKLTYLMNKYLIFAWHEHCCFLLALRKSVCKLCNLSCSREDVNCSRKCDKINESQSNNSFVETDTTVLATYGSCCNARGFRVESAQDGLDALKALSQLRPDLVVLELMLPTFDGAEVLKFIRADPRLKSVPVIIFTDPRRRN